MGIVNPSFFQAGGTPGQAAGWTLVSRCQAERWVAFGPNPAAAVEDFDRWARLKLAFAAGDQVLGFFAPGGEGHEGFGRGWDNDIFLMELSPVRSVVADFGTTDAETFDWVVKLGAWSDVVAVVASFNVGPFSAESFETGWPGDTYLRDWSSVPASGALFGTSAVETFAGAWPHASTL